MGAAMNITEFAYSSPSLLQFSQSAVGFIIIALAIVLLFYFRVLQRVFNTIRYHIFSSWQLGLLASAALVLSLASGWTTWDGMQNFTQEPTLSLMITFGVQGVMLIAAWLIGESFATGMRSDPSSDVEAGPSSSSWQYFYLFSASVIAVLLFSVVSILVLKQSAAEQSLQPYAQVLSIPNGFLLAAIVLLLAATVILNIGSDILADYLRVARIFIRGSILWVMFLACMATSVFFSFDSLFSSIFSQNERMRAAELRAQNYVSSAIDDVRNIVQSQRLREREKLFTSEGWEKYESSLDRVVQVAKLAPSSLRDHFENRMLDKQKTIARRQVEKAAAESQQARVSRQVRALNDKIAHLRGNVAKLTPVLEDLRSQVFIKDREIVTKKAEAEAEAGGIGVTSKVGRGRKYREIVSQLRILREQKKNLALQVSEYEDRLKDVRSRVSRTEGELQTTLGELATLKSRINTASNLITLAEKSTGTNQPKFDPSGGLKQLERSWIAFKQEPTKNGLAELQRNCQALTDALQDAGSAKVGKANDCDPGPASEAAEKVFALNNGIIALNAKCGAADMPRTSVGLDALFHFGRECIQSVGLPSNYTAELRKRLDYFELNRDDKAHQFVVTSNAFQDGNKLAYLALSIAIAIDTLVFMTGLFGANVTRSPLSTIPDLNHRSPQELEAIIDTALQPQIYETAQLVLSTIKPIAAEQGFTGRIVVDDQDPRSTDLRRVLNAASSIGAIRDVENTDHVYLVRRELFEYLSIVIKRQYQRDKRQFDRQELERSISIALLPDIGSNAEIVMNRLQPIAPRRGYMAELALDGAINGNEATILRATLNSGATYGLVKQVKKQSDRYMIHSDLFAALSELRGRHLLTQSSRPASPLKVVAEPKASIPVESRRTLGEETHGAISDEREFERELAQEPEHELEHVPESGPSGAELVPDLAGDVRRAFLASLAIDGDLYERGLAEISHAQSAEDLLQRWAGQVDRRVSAELETQIGEAVDRIAATSDELNARYSDQPGSGEIVSEKRKELEQVLPILIMLPGGPYLNFLGEVINQLETNQDTKNASGGGDVDLLGELRDHSGEIQEAENLEDILKSVEKFLQAVGKDNVYRLELEQRNLQIA